MSASARFEWGRHFSGLSPPKPCLPKTSLPNDRDLPLADLAVTRWPYPIAATAGPPSRASATGPKT